MAMPGAGLVKGLSVTLKTMTRRSVTRQYPDVKPVLPPRTRGVIALMEENCTVCMLCSRECPDWCIYIDSHKETVPPKEPGARARTRNMLDRFAIDFALCMYCGICIEVCPFDALFWSPEFEYSEYDIRELTHEKERLREWMYTVPAPAALDPDGAPAAEVEAAAKAEPKMYEAPALTVAGAAPAGGVATAGVAPALGEPPATHAGATPAAAPEPAAAAGPAKPKRDHPALAKEDVGVDQAVLGASLAAGEPERVARAKAKSAWMKAWKKTQDAHDEPESTTEATAPAETAVTQDSGEGDASERVEGSTPSAEAPPSPEASTDHVDVGEPQIDQETYDRAIAEGLPERVARSKAKSAWVKKARKGLA